MITRVCFSLMIESFIDEDVKKLEIIKKIVLMRTKDREERKARVIKYLSWVREDVQVLYGHQMRDSNGSLCNECCAEQNALKIQMVEQTML